ncbi:MAG: hypothetical protein WCQ32_00515 [bacterium]
MDETEFNKDELDPSAVIIEEDEIEDPIVDDDIIDPLADSDIDPITGKKKEEPEDDDTDPEFEEYMFGDRYEEM